MIRLFDHYGDRVVHFSIGAGMFKALGVSFYSNVLIFKL